VSIEQTGVTKLLLDAGANVNSVKIDGTTPLHYAALTGQLELVQALLDNGGNINACTKDGFTPLDLAIETEEFSVV
jgi:ankyrin repeat protein